MFNEGVDLPEVSTVMMLRPTESVILWLQQLGRGLRRLEGKTLREIDYIGNHRIFLTKVRALLDDRPGDRSLAMKLDEVASGQFSLPPGCSVTYELEAIKILRDLLRPKSGTEDLEAQYRDFKMREAVRPTAAEIGRMGFDPARTGHATWFEFVRDMGDPIEPEVLTTHSSLLPDRARGDARGRGSDRRARSCVGRHDHRRRRQDLWRHSKGPCDQRNVAFRNEDQVRDFAEEMKERQGTSALKDIARTADAGSHLGLCQPQQVAH